MLEEHAEMAEMHRAGGVSKREAPTKGQAEVPPFVIGIVIAVLVLVLGAGAFYAWNGGWKTQAQLQEEGKHNSMPLWAAKHGDMAPLEAENRLRKEHGEPPLEVP